MQRDVAGAGCSGALESRSRTAVGQYISRRLPAVRPGRWSVAMQANGYEIGIASANDNFAKLKKVVEPPIACGIGTMP